MENKLSAIFHDRASRRIERLARGICMVLVLLFAGVANAQEARAPDTHVQEMRDYRLAAGDSIRVVVYQIPDLTLETRVSESGMISYPLIGATPLGGLTLGDAEQRIAAALNDGGFVKDPQVNIALLQIVGNQIAVLGQAAKPGTYPLLNFNTRVSQILAAAGGIAHSGGNVVVLTGTREGRTFRKQIDLEDIYREGKIEDDIVVEAGDSLYVPKAPMFYIYGEAQRPGGYPLERGMTVRQALAVGGGPTLRGTERGLIVKRRGAEGAVVIVRPDLDELLQPDDVLNVRESLF